MEKKEEQNDHFFFKKKVEFAATYECTHSLVRNSIRQQCDHPSFSFPEQPRKYTYCTTHVKYTVYNLRHGLGSRAVHISFLRLPLLPACRSRPGALGCLINKKKTVRSLSIGGTGYSGYVFTVSTEDCMYIVVVLLC